MIANARCPCGNPVGLKKCCAKTLNSKSWTGIPVKKKVSEALADLRKVIQRRDFATANIIASRILAKVPEHPVAHYLLGLSIFMQGDPTKAANEFDIAFKAGLREAAAHLNYANIVGQRGQHELAIQHLREAVNLKSQFLQAWQMGYQLANATGAYDVAVFFGQGQVTNFPENFESWLNYANALHSNIEDDKALNALKYGLQKFPDNYELKLALAGILELQHELTQAESLIDEVLQLAPDNVDAQIHQARLLRRQGDLSAANQILNEITLQDNKNTAVMSHLHAEFVALYRLQSDFKRVWEHAKAMNMAAGGNRLLQGNWQQIETHLTAIEEITVTNKLSQISTASNDWSPLFIVGFPRTGSTLLEKVIVDKFDCISASESSAIPSVEKAIFDSFGKGWWQLDSGGRNSLDLNSLTTIVEKTYEKYQRSYTKPVVDKNLFNISRVHLIAQLFPKSPVIRLVRHPMDTIVSCYLANFSSADAWHVDIIKTATYLARLDEHWHRIHNAVDMDIWTLKYEDFVRTEAMPSELDKSLEEQWAHCNEVAVDSNGLPKQFATRTASYEQVNQPININSIGNYKNYMEFIDNRVVDILSDMIDRWGYQL